MFNNRLLNSFLGCSVALLLGVTSSPSPAFESPQDGVYNDRIDWGLTMDISGPVAAAQGQFAKGFQTRFSALNEAGGINGRKVNVLTEDNHYDVQAERVAFEKFANQTPVLGLSGMGNSSAQVALLPLINREKLPIIGTYTSAKAVLEPANPYYYGAFCGYKQMAQVGVGYFTDKLKLSAPKVAVIHLDVASGKEYFDYVDETVKARGGAATSLPIKVVAADVTPQVLQIVSLKPDFITIHGTPTNVLLAMKTLQQYSVDVPVVAITYLGAPSLYENLGPQLGKSYYFVSCFSPSSADPKAAAELIAAADKFGFSASKDDINFVSGWVVGELVAQVLTKVGAEPTRSKIVEMMKGGFEFDSRGLAPKLVYTPTDHLGLKALKPYRYDFDAKKYVSYGDFADFEKYVK